MLIYTWLIVSLNFVFKYKSRTQEGNSCILRINPVIYSDMCAHNDDIEKRTRVEILFYYISLRRRHTYTHTHTYTHYTSARWQNFNSVHTTAGCAVDDTAAYSARYKERLHAYVQFSLQERTAVGRENFLRPRILTIEPTIDRVCLPREKACGSRRHQRTTAEYYIRIYTYHIAHPPTIALAPCVARKLPMTALPVH